MWTLFKKELSGFFNSLIAYVFVAVFLLIMGLFLWVFPADFNIIDSGYAHLDGLFVLGPFVLLFLMPAITMRFFADEMRTGTLEMLLTKPLTIVRIVIAKYLAAVALLLVSLIPTVIYAVTVHAYAAPPGIDIGGVVGSYGGLLFLGMVFAAIGIFASALTENQIIAFIVALFVSGFLYIGFEMLHQLEFLGRIDLFVKDLGLFSHYSSMGRGVIDTRDVVYFLGLIVLFLTMAVVQVGRKNGRRPAGIRIVAVIVIVAAINVIGNVRFVRLDLTSEKRYSLTEATRNMLRTLDDIVYFKVYLDGELPTEFRRLRNDTREMLDEFRAYAPYVQVDFVNPSKKVDGDPDRLRDLYRMLADKGLEPTQIQMRTGDGTSQRVIFPGVLVSYKDHVVPVHLLQDHIGLSIREVLHNSSMALEYSLASAVQQLTAEKKERIAFLEGHGELAPRYLASVTESLRKFYDVDRVQIDNDYQNISGYRTLISAKPRNPFTEEEKFILDQFLMNGGSMLWLVDPVFADMDSLLYSPETVGVAMDIRMDDFFFRYGARLNPVLVKDLNAAPLPVTTGSVAGSPQINLLPWVFFPLITPNEDHQIVRNLNLIRTEFVSSIDTVEAEGVDKHILLRSSPYTRVMPVPVRIGLDILQHPVNESLYRGPPETIALLLEGRFRSLFRNRRMPDVEMPPGFVRKDTAKHAAMIVVADGDVIRNQFGSDGRALPLGYDRYSGQTFGNEDFILNAVNYLTDDSGIIEARSKDIRLRLLDDKRLKNDQVAVQVVNTALPVLLIFVFGAVRFTWRKKKHAKPL